VTVSVIRTDSGDVPALSTRCREHLKAVMPNHVNLVEVRQDASVPRQDYNLFANLLCGLNQCPMGIVYFVEQDCLYPPGYFGTEIDLAAVNISTDMVFLDKWGFQQRTIPAASMIIGEREVLRDLIWDRISRWHDRPPHLVRAVYGVTTSSFALPVPAIDIRHGNNFTGARAHRRSKAHFQSHPYWGDAAKLYGDLTVSDDDHDG